jgi:hypothetical protein
VGRPYLLVAPIFKGLPELMAIIPHFNGSTTWLTSLLLSRYSFSRKDRGHIWYKQALQASSSSFSFSFSSSSLPCLPLMASSSKKSTKGRGGTFSGKGGPSVAGKVAAPRGSKDNGGSSSFGLGSPEPLGDILGRPTIDPWYRNGERFPSIPANLQPPPADWEWLVIREDAAADVAWTPTFREIRDLANTEE